MATLKLYKEVAYLPEVLVANSVYAVRSGSGFDLYITDITGSVAHPLNKEITTKIDPSISNISRLTTEGLLSEVPESDGVEDFISALDSALNYNT